MFLKVFLPACFFFHYILFGSQVCFTGKAYSEKNEHLFTEEYVIEQDEKGVKHVSTKFVDPQGLPIAEMVSRFDHNQFLPSVSFKKENLPFEYGTLLLEKSIELFKISATRPLITKKLSIEHNMVAGHGFYFFILDKIDSLLEGNIEKMIFLQPNKLSSYTFLLKAQEKEGDQDLVDVTMQLDHKIFKAFVPEIKLCIHKSTKQILSYEGFSGFLPQNSQYKKISIQYSLAQSH